MTDYLFSSSSNNNNNNNNTHVGNNGNNHDANGPDGGAHQNNSNSNSAVVHNKRSFGSIGPSVRSVKEDEAIALQILETLLRLVDSRSLDLTLESLSQSFVICLMLASTGQPSSSSSSSSVNMASSVLASAKHKKSAGGGPAETVRRAAASTLKQIISIVLDRCNINNNTNTATAKTEIDATLEDDASLLMPVVETDLACKTFLDLCWLAEPRPTTTTTMTSSLGGEEEEKRKGPFATAAHSHPWPPRSACMELLDRMIRQNNAALGSSLSFTHSQDVGHDLTRLLYTNAYPLVMQTLTAELIPTNTKNANMSDSSSSSFALILWSFQLATTILVTTKPTSSNSDDDDDGANDEMDCQRELVLLLIQFVTIATERYRDTEHFEDGHVYTAKVSLEKQSDQGRNNKMEGKRKASVRSNYNNNNNNHASDGQHHSSGESSSEDWIPAPIVWRAALSLESLYCLIQDHFSVLVDLHLMEEQSENMDVPPPPTTTSSIPIVEESSSRLIALLAEAMSDFCTIGASCQGNILALVEMANNATAAAASTSEDGLTAADKDNNNNNSREDIPDISPAPSEDVINDNDGSMFTIQPHMFSKARAFTKLHDDWATRDETMMIRYPSDAKPSSTNNNAVVAGGNDGSKQAMPPCHIGEPIWIAFNSPLSLTRSISQQPDEAVRKSLLDLSFGPSLAVLQHILKRLPGSRRILRRALGGYVRLASVCFPLVQPGERQRMALLSSLCKLSLPAWSKTPNSNR
eukprot:scaffold26263_cov48-Attheya_sp.AAC.1